ncbi:hypothetical protein AHAS_Ahas17G0194800 [Arachis hypogaea]
MAFLAAVFILPAGTLFILSGLIVNAITASSLMDLCHVDSYSVLVPVLYQIQESDKARKKFSNAISLSSSQFLGDQNKAADVAAQATLSKFSGSSAISSAVHTLDFPRVLRLVKLSNNGVVLLCKNTGFSFSSLKWRNLLGGHGSSRGVFLCVSFLIYICYCAFRYSLLSKHMWKRMRTFSFGMRTLEFKSSTEIRMLNTISDF